MSYSQKIKARIKSENDYLTTLRRHFHKYPELSGKEEQTVKKILQELESFGYTPHLIEGNVFAVLEGAKQGKTIMLRADFDALPIIEENTCEYKSQIDGVMHACGHDAHTAMLITTAKILFDYKNEIVGKIIFCFQFGEEKGLGVMEILKHIAQYKIDTIFAIHVMTDIPVGNIMLRQGAVMAGATGFQLTVVGTGGHGSSPWEAKNPILPLCDIIKRCSSLSVNRFSVEEPLVISPCVINGGEAANIIPEKASFQSTIRFFTPGIFPRIKAEIEKIAKNISESYGTTYELLMPGAMNPVYNSKVSIDKAIQSAEKVEGLTVIEHHPYMLSDNYSILLQQYNGFYAYLGVGNKEKQCDVPHHNPKFQLDEDGMALGCEFMAIHALDLLKA